MAAELYRRLESGGLLPKHHHTEPENVSVRKGDSRRVGVSYHASLRQCFPLNVLYNIRCQSLCGQSGFRYAGLDISGGSAVRTNFDTWYRVLLTFLKVESSGVNVEIQSHPLPVSKKTATYPALATVLKFVDLPIQ